MKGLILIWIIVLLPKSIKIACWCGVSSFRSCWNDVGLTLHTDRLRVWCSFHCSWRNVQTLPRKVAGRPNTKKIKFLPKNITTSDKICLSNATSVFTDSSSLIWYLLFPPSRTSRRFFKQLLDLHSNTFLLRPIAFYSHLNPLRRYWLGRLPALTAECNTVESNLYLSLLSVSNNSSQTQHISGWHFSTSS